MVISFIFQVKIWFQNRRSKYKKIMKQSPNSNPNPSQGQLGAGNQGSMTPQPQQPPQQTSPTPPTQHPSEIPTSQHGQPHQQPGNANIPNGHHHPSMIPPPASSVSPQPELKWSEINSMNASVANNAYMPPMPAMAPHHYSWYSQPHQQSLLT